MQKKEGECVAIGTLKLEVVYVVRELAAHIVREGLRPGTVSARACGGELAHHPLVGFVGDVKRGDGAPAHGTRYGIADGGAGVIREDGPYLCEPRRPLQYTCFLHHLHLKSRPSHFSQNILQPRLQLPSYHTLPHKKT